MLTFGWSISSGVRWRLFVAVLLLIVVWHSSASGQAAVPGGSYYALVIGINEYGHGLPKLKTAVNDAEGVAKVLSEQYGFKVRLLTDADGTRDNILGAMDQYRRTLRDNDSLLIYYAGHGYADKDEDKAYWIPVDADRSTTSHWISADDLTSKMRADPARHVLVISDSCYSGGLLRDANIDVRPVEVRAYLDKMTLGRSRTLMSSGGDEPVSDGGGDEHSVFAKAVLGALRGTLASEFSAGDLFHDYVLRQVAGNADQIPRYASIRNSGDGAGDFIFRKAKEGFVAQTAAVGSGPITAPLAGVGLRVEEGQRRSATVPSQTESTSELDGSLADCEKVPYLVSALTGGRASMTFINKTKNLRVVSRVAVPGNLEHLDKAFAVAPGASVTETVFGVTYWLVQDENSHCIGVYKAGSSSLFSDPELSITLSR